MTSMTRPSEMLPAYELDSVNEDRLEALISQLGLKKHSKTAMDPCCVICRPWSTIYMEGTLTSGNDDWGAKAALWGAIMF